MYSVKLNEGQHGCTPERTMYDPYYIRLPRIYYVTRLRRIHHYYQQIQGVEPILCICWPSVEDDGPILRQHVSQSDHDKSAS